MNSEEISVPVGALSERLYADSELFEADPEAYIYSLLGNEIQNMTYIVSDIVYPDGHIVVDVHYDKLLAPALKTIYVDVKDLKQMNQMQKSYIFEYGPEKIPVRFICSAAIIKSSNSIPVIIHAYNKQDEYYHYIARPLKEPLHAYSTIISKHYNLDTVFPQLSTNDEIGKELYDEKETKKSYSDEIANFDIFKSVNTIKEIKSFKETLNANDYTAFILSYDELPDKAINGHIIITDHRKSNLLLYYPNVANIIDADEIAFIKRFMRYDASNLPK